MESKIHLWIFRKGVEMKKSVISFMFCFVAMAASAIIRYEPTWESLDKRPVPSWWTDAKFGIFVHWGPYAVPAYAPISPNGRASFNSYAEWYQGRLRQGRHEFVEYHKKRYGNAPYANFAAQFTATNYNPKAWAELFKKAGAKYVVLTSKHHDGYALWPSPESPYYNSVVLGSGRDLAGEFCSAMRAAGLKRGFYFSMLEFANPQYQALHKKGAISIEQWAQRINIPQLKELANDYEADIIWPDGEWDFSSDQHSSKEYLTWLFNQSRVKDRVVVNDRWGNDCRGKHGGHYTTEYGAGSATDAHPWEECRGIGLSFGYNQYETEKEYMTPRKCIETLVSCVSRGGNLLLNVGPTADGRIPDIMQERLLAMGSWLNVNGEAIYGSKMAVGHPAQNQIYFTSKPNTLYAIAFRWPKNVRITGTGKVKSVSLLGSNSTIAWNQDGDDIVITADQLPELPCEHAWTFKIVQDH